MTRNTFSTAALDLAASRRLSCNPELASELDRTHRHLLMQLGSGRDTVVWETVLDASPTVVWEAAAASLEVFFDHVPNAGAVLHLDETGSEQGSRFVVESGLAGATGARFGEVLVNLKGRMLAASDVDPRNPGDATTLPTLHGIRLRAHETSSHRTVVTLSSVTLGTYHMWQLPVLMAQAESIRTKVAAITGERIPDNLVKLDYRRTTAETKPAEPLLVMAARVSSDATISSTTGNHMDTQRHFDFSRLTNWFARFAALTILFAAAAAAAFAAPPTFELPAVYELVSHRGPYQYDHRYERIYLMSDGHAVVSVTVDADGTLQLRGVIARIGRMSPEGKAAVLKNVEVFNFRSTVGAMSYDEATGEIRLSQRLDARTMSDVAAARTIVEFTDVVRAETVKFAEAVLNGEDYCSIMCSRK